MELILQVHEKVKDLGLDGYIQGRYRFIRNNKLRLNSQRPGNSNALSLAAGKLMAKNKTAMGSRYLKYNIENPLTNKEAIERRCV